MESGIKYVKGNFILGEIFSSLLDMNRQGINWLERIANIRIHGTTGVAVNLRLKEEKEYLSPLRPHLRFDTAKYSPRKISRDCLLSYEGCRYSVPHTFAGRVCLVKDTEDGLFQVLVEGKVACTHHLSKEKRRTIIKEEHYRGIKVEGNRPRKSLPLLSPFALPEVESRPLSVYEEAGGVK